MTSPSPNIPRTHRSFRRWTGVAIALVVVVVLGAVATAAASRRSIGRAALAARVAFSAGRYDEAWRAVERWLRLAPRSPEAAFLQARLALALDRPHDVVEACYTRAKEYGAPESDLALFRALVKVRVGQHVDAEPILRQAYEEAASPDPQVDQALARVYLETFNLRRARGVIDRWAREAPDDPKPHLWRAEVDQRDESPTESLVADYREALKRDPNLAKARLGLADALRSLHRAAEAQSEYDAYLQLKPDDPEGHLGAGRNARELGDDQAAARCFERVLKLDPKNAATHKEIADVAIRQGADAKALAHLDLAIRFDPFDLNTRYTRGLVLGRLGRTEDARREQLAAKKLRAELVELTDLKNRLIRSPNDPAIESKMAEWMFAHGHDEGGVRWAKKILLGQPAHPVANRLLADYYKRQGNPGLANFYRLQGDLGP